jgi:hypothetical protein
MLETFNGSPLIGFVGVARRGAFIPNQSRNGVGWRFIPA